MGPIFTLSFFAIMALILYIMVEVNAAKTKKLKIKEKIKLQEKQQRLDAIREKENYARQYAREYLDKNKYNFELIQKLTGIKPRQIILGTRVNDEDLLDTYYKIKKYEKEIKEIQDKKQSEIIAKENQRINASNAGKLIDLSIEPINNYNNTQPGVYIIVNNKTLDFYIGESQNMNFRRKTHLGELVDECHHSKLMQEHFNRFGKNVFDFYALERKGMHDDNVRRYAEERWIKEYKPTYNSEY